MSCSSDVLSAQLLCAGTQGVFKFNKTQDNTIQLDGVDLLDTPQCQSESFL